MLKSQYPKSLMLMSGIPSPLVFDLAEGVFTDFLILCPYFLFFKNEFSSKLSLSAPINCLLFETKSQFLCYWVFLQAS